MKRKGSRGNNKTAVAWHSKRKKCRNKQEDRAVAGNNKYKEKNRGTKGQSKE